MYYFKLKLCLIIQIQLFLKISLLLITKCVLMDSQRSLWYINCTKNFRIKFIFNNKIEFCFNNLNCHCFKYERRLMNLIIGSNVDVANKTMFMFLKITWIVAFLKSVLWFTSKVYIDQSNYGFILFPCKNMKYQNISF